MLIVYLCKILQNSMPPPKHYSKAIQHNFGLATPTWMFWTKMQKNSGFRLFSSPQIREIQYQYCPFRPKQLIPTNPKPKRGLQQAQFLPGSSNNCDRTKVGYRVLELFRCCLGSTTVKVSYLRLSPDYQIRSDIVVLKWPGNLAESPVPFAQWYACQSQFIFDVTPCLDLKH